MILLFDFRLWALLFFAPIAVWAASVAWTTPTPSDRRGAGTPPAVNEPQETTVNQRTDSTFDVLSSSFFESTPVSPQWEGGEE
ncbi:MAG: hypothetical protein AAFV53_00375 [Myxococcota bacterium]